MRLTRWQHRLLGVLVAGAAFWGGLGAAAAAGGRVQLPEVAACWAAGTVATLAGLVVYDALRDIWRNT